MRAETEAFWERFYDERDVDRPMRGRPVLERGVAGLEPGRALDLGCGEGGDAIWLAGLGWHVTGADVSAVALDRAAQRATAAGVADRVRWERHDLAATFPDGDFDLVSAQFLHSPIADGDERDAILRRAATAVVPGGRLVIGVHSSPPTWAEHAAPDLPSTADIRAGLALDPDVWEVEIEATMERDLPAPDGRPGTRQDGLLRVRRRPRQVATP